MHFCVIKTIGGTCGCGQVDKPAKDGHMGSTGRFSPNTQQSGVSMH